MNGLCFGYWSVWGIGLWCLEKGPGPGSEHHLQTVGPKKAAQDIWRAHESMWGSPFSRWLHERFLSSATQNYSWLNMQK